MHLFGFFIRIYHDVRSPERQRLNGVKVLNTTKVFTPKKKKTAAKTRE